MSIEDAWSHLTPLLHTALFRRVSMRTSGVPISFTANLRISLIARGALFLKPLQLKHYDVNNQSTNILRVNFKFVIFKNIPEFENMAWAELKWSSPLIYHETNKKKQSNENVSQGDNRDPKDGCCPATLTLRGCACGRWWCTLWSPLRWWLTAPSFSLLS